MGVDVTKNLRTGESKKDARTNPKDERRQLRSVRKREHVKQRNIEKLGNED